MPETSFAKDTTVTLAFSVDRNTFQEVLTKAASALPEHNIKPTLNNFRIVARNGAIKVSAANIYLSVIVEATADVAVEGVGIFPGKTLREVVSSANDEVVSVEVVNSLVKIKAGTATWEVRLMRNEDYPDLDEIMLKPVLANNKELRVDRDELLSTLSRARICADTETSAVALVLNEGVMRVESKDRAGQRFSETVQTGGWKGKEQAVAFHHTYLMQMVENVSSQTCVFRLGKDTNTYKNPMVLEDVANGYVGIITQMRLDVTQ